MNRDEILSMEAGEQMDNLIATRVMGFEILGYPAIPRWQKPREDGGVDMMFSLPPYSSNIAAAWEVVEKLTNGGYYHFYVGYNASNKNWEAIFYRDGYELTAVKIMTLHAAPLAICRAALLAVMEALNG